MSDCDEYELRIENVDSEPSDDFLRSLARLLVDAAERDLEDEQTKEAC